MRCEQNSNSYDFLRLDKFEERALTDRPRRTGEKSFTEGKTRVVSRRKVSINNDRPYLLVLLLQGELLLLHLLQLIAEVELGGFLLKLRKFVLVFRHLLQGWLHARGEEAR